MSFSKLWSGRLACSRSSWRVGRPWKLPAAVGAPPHCQSPAASGARCGVGAGPWPHRRPLVAEALSLHRVDDRGLDASDRRLLTLMLEGYGGGPVGLDTLAAGLGEDSATLEAVVEPYLLQLGFLQRTPGPAGYSGGPQPPGLAG